MVGFKDSVIQSQVYNPFSCKGTLAAEASLEREGRNAQSFAQPAFKVVGPGNAPASKEGRL